MYRKDGKMNGERLFIKAGDVFKETNAFVCTNCNMSNRTQQGADDCCLCCRCKKKPREQHYIYCEECKPLYEAERKEKDAEKDKAALDKATEVTEFEFIWYEENMYPSVGEMIECLACDMPEEDYPDFVFAMKQVKFSGFSYDYLIENSDEDMCEDVYVEEVLFGLDELKQAFKDCNELNKDTVVFWEADYTKKVKVTQF